MPPLASGFATYRHQTGPSPHQHFRMSSLDSHPLNPANKAPTPSPQDSSHIRSIADEMILEWKFKIMTELKVELDAAIKGTAAPPLRGKVHPSDIIGSNSITPHHENPATAAIEVNDSIPTPNEIRYAHRLPTLDCSETEAENFFLAHISTYESTLVDEVTLFPECRVQVMYHVNPTGEEYEALEPTGLDIYKHYYPVVLRNTPDRPTINPNIVQQRRDPLYNARRAAKEHWAILGRLYGDGRYWYERDVRTEKGSAREANRHRRRYRRHHRLPTRNVDTNSYRVSASTSTAPVQIQTLTRSYSNLRTAILMLYRWFNLPMPHLAAIVNHTFATGLDPVACARILRGAKLHRLDEYVDVFELTAWHQRRKRHATLYRCVKAAATALHMPMVPRREDIEIYIVDREGGEWEGDQVGWVRRGEGEGA
ncbi:MAG: hypothetical protein M1839_000329 [Geoglossum umbratile]|nr:MAG: hypothetical protein M1839_000329 [Geoglossum umbratile]